MLPDRVSNPGPLTYESNKKKNVSIPLVNESFLSLVDGNNMRKFFKPFNNNINNKTKG